MKFPLVIRLLRVATSEAMRRREIPRGEADRHASLNMCLTSTTLFLQSKSFNHDNLPDQNDINFAVNMLHLNGNHPGTCGTKIDC